MPQRKMVPLQFKGLNTDKSPDTLEPEELTAVTNVYSREHMTRVNGKEEVFGPTLFPPLWLLNTVERATELPAWIYTADTGVGVVVDQIHSDITPVGLASVGITQNPYTGGELNGVPAFNQRNDVPYFWDGNTANVCQPLPGWPTDFHTGFLRPYKFHFIAGYVDPGTGQFDPDFLIWSDAAPPGSVPNEWTPSPTNEAGSVSMGQTPGVIVDGKDLRGSFYVYKSTSTYRLTYVGGAQVMRSELVFPESGVLSRNCVAALNTFHCVLTDNDVIVHDGQNLRSIANDRVRREIFSRIDPDNVGKSFVVANSNENEFWICIPEFGADFPTIAYVWNAPDDAWGIRELTEAPAHIAVGRVEVPEPGTTWDEQTETWDDDPGVWDTSGTVIGRYDLLSAGIAASRLYLLDQTALDDGAAVPAVFQRVTLDLGEPERNKFLKAVWISAQGETGTNIRVRVAGQQQPQDPVLWGEYQAFVIGSGQSKVDVATVGRFLSVEISSIDAQTRWRLPEVTLEVESAGLY